MHRFHNVVAARFALPVLGMTEKSLGEGASYTQALIGGRIDFSPSPSTATCGLHLGLVNARIEFLRGFSTV